MKSLLTNRKAGVYVLIVSILLQLVSAVNYLVWASGAGGIDTLVALGLGIGCLVGIAAFLFSSDLLLVADTALCSCGMLQLAVSSAGSFADWYQGIVMFGDPSQVPAHFDHLHFGADRRCAFDHHRLYGLWQAGDIMKRIGCASFGRRSRALRSAFFNACSAAPCLTCAVVSDIMKKISLTVHSCAS